MGQTLDQQGKVWLCCELARYTQLGPTVMPSGALKPGPKSSEPWLSASPVQAVYNTHLLLKLMKWKMAVYIVKSDVNHFNTGTFIVDLFKASKLV